MFTVYSASAGSGKTYNLVFDYLAASFKNHLPGFLKLEDKREYRCERCNGYQDILAITFTNNAGSEMKDRVVRRLNDLAFASSHNDLDHNDFQNLSIKVFGERHQLSPEERFLFLNRTSMALLHDVLYDYARFSITTIDSFIQRLIRSSALYLNLSMNYAVQIRLTDFFRAAIEQYICELSQNEQQFRVVAQELNRQLEDRGSANIRRFLTKSLHILYKDAEKSHPFVKNLAELSDLLTIIDYWRIKKQQIELNCKKQLEPICAKALQLFSQAEAEGITANQSSKWDSWFKNLINDPFEVSKSFENSKIQKGMDRNKIFKAATKNKNQLLEEIRETYIGEIETLFFQVQQIVNPQALPFYTYRALSQNANYLLVLNALANHIETIKEQTDTFFLSESNPLVNDEIQSDTKGEPLFEKWRFRHLFIDEFQDTSLMQWQDLKPMIINTLGENGEITLFGDVKQSIYRFRNGDVNLFYHLMDYHRLRETREEQEIAALLPNEQALHLEPLNVNYRSQSAVIRFNNHFFDFYAQKLKKEDYYKDVEQKTTRKQGGLVQILPYHEKQPYKDLRTVWPDCPEDYYQQVYLNLRPEEAELIYAVKDAKMRGYSYGDMAVLLRGRAKCNTFAQRLMTAGVPVVTSDSLQLCDNPGINVIISTMRLIINAKDNLSQTAILQFCADKCLLPFHQLLEETHHSGFFEVLQRHLQKPDLQKLFIRWEQDPLLITVKEIIRFYDFPSDKDPFIADLLDLVHEYAQSNAASVAGFLSWWDDLHLSGETIPRLSLSDRSGAVRLMTIHASKGMEFPVVITWCNASVPQPSSYWVEDLETGQNCYVAHDKSLKFSAFSNAYEEEESKRLLDVLNLWYVDFTRARDMLYILTEFSTSEPGEKTDVKSLLQLFAHNQYSNTDNISGQKITIEKNTDGRFYFGDLAWQKQKKEEKEDTGHSDFKVSCSTMTFFDNEKIKVNVSESKSAATEMGTHIHRILQKLVVFPATEEEREAVVLGEPEPIRTRMLQWFAQEAEDSELHPYLFPDGDDQVMNETTIITENGQELRPDRIVIKPDHVMVIDYKTGHDHKDYSLQLSMYQNAIRKMGYGDVRTKLLFIQ